MIITINIAGFVSVISGHEEVYHTPFSKAEEYQFVNASDAEMVTAEGLINMTAKFIGFNNIKVILYGDGKKILGNDTLLVGVTLKDQKMPAIFEKCLTALLVLLYINMGANIDLDVVKKIVKQPIGPAIGLLSQYICMPLISFGLGLLAFPNEPLFRLGLFTSGCAPGGGLSNMWTHLLGGSLDLSIMMTFASTAFALGTVPLWLLTLGKVIIKEANFVIPYLNVFLGILIMVIPSIIGIIIQLKFKRLTKLMNILLTPLSVFNILFIVTFGVYANLYLFSYMTVLAVLAGFAQTISGLLIGYFIAFICRRTRRERIAIGIETAVQNNNIAFLILKMSLGKPQGDLAVWKVPEKDKSEEPEDESKVKEEKEKIENKDNNNKAREAEEKGIDNPGLENTYL
ncbi:Solute carrier family 10 member 6 [Armadillidium nasatum]|uniref:Solute carrier family 10 member 6 n=1 Tax=Armadillidium nasatum TaxID=96803 RepID=A0A5N5SW46_9CRUS|nr:Solute carrier family 10 member 6 [Armadillidium nasatum]